MKVLVTGAGGFLGGHLVAALLARGYQVVGLDIAFPSALPAPARQVTGSVIEVDHVANAAEGCDAVIHAAAITGLWARDPGLFERVNAGGTATVLGAAAAAGATRAVLVSSYTTLIAGRRGAPEQVLDETHEHTPDVLLGSYPRSKRLAELIAAEAELPTSIVLPSAPIGPGDRTPTPPMKMLRDLADGRLPAMIDCMFNLVHIATVADGVLAALDRGRGGRRYLLSGEDLSTDELLSKIGVVARIDGPRAKVPFALAVAAARIEAAISRITGRPPAAPLTGVRLAGPRCRFSNARAREELGIEPRGTNAALRDALAWMKAEGMIERDLPRLGAYQAG